jgi:hypothetical protein
MQKGSNQIPGVMCKCESKLSSTNRVQRGTEKSFAKNANSFRHHDSSVKVRSASAVQNYTSLKRASQAIS